MIAPTYALTLAPIGVRTPRRYTLLRKAAARSVDELWRVIGESLDAFTPGECANYFAAAGYDAW